MNGLMSCGFAAGLRLFPEADGGNHSRNGDPQKPEATHISQHGGLPLSSTLHKGISPLSCAGGAGSVGHHRAGSPLNRGSQRSAAGTEMTGKIGQVCLGSAVQHGGDDGNSNAAANVAREVHQARSGVVLLARKESVGGGIDGNEQESHAGSLDHTRSSQSPEIDLKVKASHVEQRERQDDETEQEKPSRSVPRKQKAHEWQQKNDGETTRHKNQASLLRRIAKQSLREQRQQQSAAQQSKAQHKHQQIRHAEGSIAEEMQIDDGIFVPPLPNNHEN